MFLSDVEKIRLAFDHGFKKPMAIVTCNGIITKHLITNPLTIDKGEVTDGALVNITNIRQNRSEAFNSMDADLYSLKDYKKIWQFLDSKLVATHTANHKEYGEYPGSNISVMLHGLDTPIDLSYETNEVGEPFYTFEGLVPLSLLKWLEHMYHYMGIVTEKWTALKPSDFSVVLPLDNAVDVDSAGHCAGYIMECLKMQGDTWRQLTWAAFKEWQEEYLEEDYVEKILFDEVIDYCQSPSTAFLFSDDWKNLKQI